MAIKPKPIVKRKLSYFEDQGSGLKKYPLLRAVYFDDTQRAIRILAEDPDQLNLPDPFGGLTATHIAIFRENKTLVELFAKHPLYKPQIKDNFGRRAVDMLDYTINQQIFNAIIEVTYPDEIRSLEDETYERGMSDGSVIPLKPKEP